MSSQDEGKDDQVPTNSFFQCIVSNGSNQFPRLVLLPCSNYVNPNILLGNSRSCPAVIETDNAELMLSVEGHISSSDPLTCVFRGEKNILDGMPEWVNGRICLINMLVNGIVFASFEYLDVHSSAIGGSFPERHELSLIGF